MESVTRLAALASAPANGELARLNDMARTLNATSDLDKDSFLKILVTQLTHQDPIQPMEDREFIAQMAQFSTLEQMTNLSSEMGQLRSLFARNQALALLGQFVEIRNAGSFVQGRVEAVTGSEFPQILVNDRYYDASTVERVLEVQIP